MTLIMLSVLDVFLLGLYCDCFSAVVVLYRLGRYEAKLMPHPLAINARVLLPSACSNFPQSFIIRENYNTQVFD